MYLVIMIGLLSIACALYAQAIKRMTRTIVRKRRIFGRPCIPVSHRCTLIDYTAELRDCEERIRQWKILHPFGPQTSREYEEFQELVFNQAGAHLAMCADLNMPFSPEVILAPVDRIEDWRS